MFLYSCFYCLFIYLSIYIPIPNMLENLPVVFILKITIFAFFFLYRKIIIKYQKYVCKKITIYMEILSVREKQQLHEP